MPESTEKNTKQPGGVVWVLWGRFGMVKAVVHHTSKSGTMYVRRWNRHRKMYTVPRKVEVYPSGQWMGEECYRI